MSGVHCFIFFKSLNRAGFFKGCESAVLFNSLKAFDGYVHDDGFVQLGNKNAALLEVGLAAHLACRIKLGRAGAVRIPPAYLRALPSDFTCSCHSGRMVALRPQTGKSYGNLSFNRNPHLLRYRA